MTVSPRIKSIVLGAGLLAILVMFAFSGGSGECSQAVNGVVFSPDGKTLAAGMYNSRDAQVQWKHYAADVCRTVELFSVETGESNQIVDQEMRLGNQGPLHRLTPAVAFLNAGRYLAVLLNGRVDVWDVAARQKVRLESALDERVWGFAYSPKEDLVALGTDSGVFIRDVLSRRNLFRIDADGPPFWQQQPMIFSPDGKLFAVPKSHDGVIVLDIQTGNVRSHHLGTIPAIISIAFCHDVRWAAIATQGAMYLLDLDTGDSEQVTLFGASLGREFQAASLPDARTVISVGTLGATLVDLEGGFAERKINALPDRAMFSVAVSPDGKLLATGDNLGAVTLWDAAGGTKIREMRVHGKYRIPWTVPAVLLIIWLLWCRIATTGGLLPQAVRRSPATTK